VLRAYAPDPERYAVTTCPEWVGELDWAAGGAPVRMGTHALREDQWLLDDERGPYEIALRRRLLAEQRDLVFACTAPAEAAAEEAAALVEGWRTARPMTDPAEPVATHPLARAGAKVQEDLCLMVRHEDAWRLDAAVLCFPSLWVLAEKLGRPAALIHEPVPHYAEHLSGRVDTFFDRLAPGRLVWRRNFAIWPALLLWAPCHELPPSLCPAPPRVGDAPTAWLRSERQTLRRLPGTGALLFTIRVQTAPLAVLVQRPARARSLAEWLRSPSGEARRGQMGPALAGTLDWLDAVGREG